MTYEPPHKTILRLRFKQSPKTGRKSIDYKIYITGKSGGDRLKSLNEEVIPLINGLTYNIYDERGGRLIGHGTGGDKDKSGRRPPKKIEKEVVKRQQLNFYKIPFQPCEERLTLTVVIKDTLSYSRFNTVEEFNDELRTVKKSLNIPLNKREGYYPHPLPQVVKGWKTSETPPVEFPIFIISKGRNLFNGNRMTWDLLDDLHLKYRVVVEPRNRWSKVERFDEYRDKFGDRLMIVDDEYLKIIDEHNNKCDPMEEIKMSVIQRSYVIWYLNKTNSPFSCHWDLDDNIQNFMLMNKLSCKKLISTYPFNYIETVCNNLSFSLGGFMESGKGGSVRDTTRELSSVGSRVFSCTLINHRHLHEKGLNFIGHLNEDLILNIRCLKEGLGVFRTNQIRIVKPSTSNTKNKGGRKPMEGGNTELHGVIQENGKTGVENRLNYAKEICNSDGKELVKTCHRNKKSYDKHFNINYHKEEELKGFERDKLPKIIEEVKPEEFYTKYEIVEI